MSRCPPLPDGVIDRAEAAAILGVGRKRVTNLLWSGQLRPAEAPGRKIGVFWREEVEALAAARSERRRKTEQMLPKPVPFLPMDQDATLEELKAAAEWTKEGPGAFVDSEGAAEILGVTPQYVGKLSKQGRLPWLPTGRVGGGPTRVYRRAQLEVIARARRFG